MTVLIWTEFKGDRGTKSKPIPGPHQVYGFLTTSPNAVIEPTHPNAMPVILMTRSATSGCAHPGMKPKRCSGRCPTTRSGSPPEVLTRKTKPPHEIRHRTPLRDPEKAARRLMEHAQAFEPIQDGRIYIEKINGPFLFGDQARRRNTRRARAGDIARLAGPA